MRENRTHGSEGGDGESRPRPLSGSIVTPVKTGAHPRNLDADIHRHDGFMISIGARVITPTLTIRRRSGKRIL